MWVAKYYKDNNKKHPNPYYLWNRKPEKVSELVNKVQREWGYSEHEYDSHHGSIALDTFWQWEWEWADKGEPIEVELIKEFSDSPMFYGQKILDSKGNENVYIGTRLEYKFHKPYGGFKLFGKRFRYKTGMWIVSMNPPEGEYCDLSVNVSTYFGHRIRPKDFPWSIEDGIVPVTLKIK